MNELEMKKALKILIPLIIFMLLLLVVLYHFFCYSGNRICLDEDDLPPTLIKEFKEERTMDILEKFYVNGEMQGCFKGCKEALESEGLEFDVPEVPDVCSKICER